MKFAKIIDIDEEVQVLAELSFDNDEDRYKLRFRTDIAGITSEIVLRFKSEQKASDELEKFDRSNAIAFRENMLATIF